MPLRVHAIQSHFAQRCDSSREVCSLWQLLLKKRSKYLYTIQFSLSFNGNGKQLACSLVKASNADWCDLNIRAQSLILLSIYVFPSPSLVPCKTDFHIMIQGASVYSGTDKAAVLGLSKPALNLVNNSPQDWSLISKARASYWFLANLPISSDIL